MLKGMAFADKEVDSKLCGTYACPRSEMISKGNFSDYCELDAGRRLG